MKYVTKPGQRFVIRREAYQRILEAIREYGIGLAGRGVVVRLKGAEAPGRRAAAFAAAAVRRAAAGAA